MQQLRNADPPEGARVPLGLIWKFYPSPTGALATPCRRADHGLGAGDVFPPASLGTRTGAVQGSVPLPPCVRRDRGRPRRAWAVSGGEPAASHGCLCGRTRDGIPDAAAHAAGLRLGSCFGAPFPPAWAALWCRRGLQGLLGGPVGRAAFPVVGVWLLLLWSLRRPLSGRPNPRVQSPHGPPERSGHQPGGGASDRRGFCPGEAATQCVLACTSMRVSVHGDLCECVVGTCLSVYMCA